MFPWRTDAHHGMCVGGAIEATAAAFFSAFVLLAVFDRLFLPSLAEQAEDSRAKGAKRRDVVRV